MGAFGRDGGENAADTRDGGTDPVNTVVCEGAHVRKTRLGNAAWGGMKGVAKGCGTGGRDGANQKNEIWERRMGRQEDMLKKCGKKHSSGCHSKKINGDCSSGRRVPLSMEA